VSRARRRLPRWLEPLAGLLLLDAVCAALLHYFAAATLFYVAGVLAVCLVLFLLSKLEG
jgi:hypothetical protein